MVRSSPLKLKLEAEIAQWLEKREKDPRMWKAPGTLALLIERLVAAEHSRQCKASFILGSDFALQIFQTCETNEEFADRVKERAEEIYSCESGNPGSKKLN